MFAPYWIRESNLIEDVDELAEDKRSLRAWNWLLKQPKLTESVILTLHRRIMLKKLSKEAGKLRLCNVSVGGRMCPHYSQVPGLFDNWLKVWAMPWNKPHHIREEVAELIQQAHIEFEHVHPFIDGNGRTGRMIMNWQRVKAGLDPLCIEYTTRWEYYAWFK